MNNIEIIKDLKNFCAMSKKEENFIYYSEYKFCEEIAERVQGLLDLYTKEKLNTLNLSEQLNKEKEKNKKLEDKIKKTIKEIERRMNLANECIEQEIVIADSDSLNYGRAQAHDVDRVLLMDVVTVADENKIKEILE